MRFIEEKISVMLMILTFLFYVFGRFTLFESMVLLQLTGLNRLVLVYANTKKSYTVKIHSKKGAI